MDRAFKQFPTKDNTVTLLMIKSYAARKQFDKLMFFYHQLQTVTKSHLRYVVASLISVGKLGLAYYELQKHVHIADAPFFFNLLNACVRRRDLQTAFKVYALNGLDFEDPLVVDLVGVLFSRACYHGHYSEAEKIYKDICSKGLPKVNIMSAVLDLHVNTKPVGYWYDVWKSMKNTSTPWISTLDKMIHQVEGLEYAELKEAKPMDFVNVQAQLKYC